MNAVGDRASAPVVCGLRTVGGLFAGVPPITAATAAFASMMPAPIG